MDVDIRRVVTMALLHLPKAAKNQKKLIDQPII
jgi:hypothetical protein